MKTIILIAGCMLAAFICQGQKIKASDLPVPVKAAFLKLYPQVSNAKWEKEKSGFEAEFEVNEKHCSVVIDAAGNLVETETEISRDVLPPAAVAHLEKNYSGKQIKEIAKIQNVNGSISYEVEFHGKELFFDASGELIK